MLITVKESVRQYHVGFSTDNSKVFTRGPHKGAARTKTMCEIKLLTEVVGTGVTVLGPKDVPNSRVACKIALARALKQARLGRYVNTMIWQEWWHALVSGKPQMVTCRDARQYTHAGDRCHRVREGCLHRVKAKGSGNDWCTESRTDCSVHGYGGSHSHRKKMIAHSVSGLGWTRLVPKRTHIEKLRLYRKMYSPQAQWLNALSW